MLQYDSYPTENNRIELINYLHFKELRCVFTANMNVFSNIEIQIKRGPSWSWSYGSWINNYLCNQCLIITTKVVSSNPIHVEVYSIQHYAIVCQWLPTVTLISSTNTTDRHDITEILLKRALNIINQTKPDKKDKYQYLDQTTYKRRKESTILHIN
jgi:hypothetical protein